MTAPATTGPGPVVAARAGWRTWGGWFALAVVVGATWAVALPTYAGPDEQTHVTKAAAVVRGQLHGRDVETGIGTYTVVRVPEILGDRAASEAKGCYSGFGEVPASCASRLDGSRRDVDAITYVGRYPPWYYAAVGLPSLVSPGPVTPLLLRLVAVTIGAAVLASALASATVAARGTRLVLGVLVAVTPMVSYLAGVVNPNGLEVVAALSAATAVAALGVAPAQHRPALVRRAVVGFALCALSRTPSLAYAVLAVALPWFALGPERRPRLRELPGIGPALASLGVVAGAAAAWALALPTGDLGDALTRESVATSVRETGRFLRQGVGVFGELDTPLPAPVWVGWLAIVAVLCVVGLLRGSARQRLALLAAIVATVAIPVVAQALAVPPVGARWQGRYGLPIAVVVPVLAASAAGRRPGDGRWVPAVAGAVAVGQVAALATVLRRYEVGADGPIWFLPDTTWRPAVVSVGLVAMAAAAWAWSAARATRAAAADRGGTGPAG